MRMRTKPNLNRRMDNCTQVLVSEPELYRGNWLSGEYNALRLEIGCGKGAFTVSLADAYPDDLIIAVEMVPEALITAMERAVTRAESSGRDNLRFVCLDAVRLEELFIPNEISMIYINFCDPWPKSRNEKRRLTSDRFQQIYASLLVPGGEIHFKTDNLPLFDFSLRQFAEAGFELSEITTDLHGDGISGIMSDYEHKFMEKGIKICRAVARKAVG